MSGAMYDPLLPRLSGDRLAVAPDRLGFGFSDLPPRPLSMAEYAQSTLDVAHALGIEQFTPGLALEAAVSIPHAAFRHAAVPVAPAEE
jgi:pimeloyl-ACP methyl ester carboxylesterase